MKKQPTEPLAGTLELLEKDIRAELSLSPHLPKLTQRAMLKWANQLAVALAEQPQKEKK